MLERVGAFPVMMGGWMRSAQEIRAPLAQSGLRPGRVIEVGAHHITEGTAAGPWPAGRAGIHGAWGS